ncbi:MAG TPA: hypothetical protein VFH42_04195, partial [Sporolactobacillaceae bacterium]|nr:hypothetical protein [Sporolactobacillaceae bacterium]
MIKNALEGIQYFREQMNLCRFSEVNRLVADDFFAVFSLGKERSIEIYRAEEYKLGNLEVAKLYEGRNPYWDYKDIENGMRFEDEVIVSSKIDFYLEGSLLMHALCTEIYRYDDPDWKLARQY